MFTDGSQTSEFIVIAERNKWKPTAAWTTGKHPNSTCFGERSAVMYSDAFWVVYSVVNGLKHAKTLSSHHSIEASGVVSRPITEHAFSC